MFDFSLANNRGDVPFPIPDTEPVFQQPPFVNAKGTKEFARKTLFAIVVLIIFVALMAQRLFHPR
jgi:hypothetical protein